MTTEELYKLINNASISIDTRTLTAGDIYIGLKGEQFDGNTYAKDALDKGAKLVIIDNLEYKVNDQCILVENSYETLRELAILHRQTFSIPILAIGGSNGKTTTKELVSAVLSTTHNIHVTNGNLNNEIGVPLTLLSMPRDTQIAIIEIGANHPDEHTRLMNIVSPTHVLITNNGADHLEGFGTIEGVRKANKEIYDCARLMNATAFVNSHITDLVEDSADMNRILYPEQLIESISTIYAGLKYGHTEIHSNLFGSFNEANILAAIAVGMHFNVPLEKIAEAIQVYQPTLKRSQIIEKDGYTMIMDCYNANPTSMELSLLDFFRTSQAGSRIIVVGDMLEVGETELATHLAILHLIEEHKNVNDVVICVGPRFLSQQQDFPYHFFQTSKEGAEYFKTLVLEDKQIFLKASRGIRLEDILI